MHWTCCLKGAHGYEEMIQNNSFKVDLKSCVHWNIDTMTKYNLTWNETKTTWSSKFVLHIFSTIRAPNK